MEYLVQDDYSSDEIEDDDPRWEVGEELEGFQVAGAQTTTDDVSVVGGRLLEGAVRVEVDTRSGTEYKVIVQDGYWLATAIIDSVFFSPSVTFWDAKGKAVLMPLPSHVITELITGEREPCQKCGTVNWLLASVPRAETDEITDAFYEEWSPGRRAAVCQNCGFLVELPQLGTTIQVEVSGPHPSEEEMRKTQAVAKEKVWSEFGEKSGLAPLGLDTKWIHGKVSANWSGGDGEIDQVGLSYFGSDGFAPPTLHVTTYVQDDPNLGLDDWTMRSDLGRSIAVLRVGPHDFYSDDPQKELDAHLELRRAEQEVHELSETEILIPVDGRPTAFSLLRHDLCWSARGSIGTACVGLSGAGVAPESVVLRPIEPSEID